MRRLAALAGVLAAGIGLSPAVLASGTIQVASGRLRLAFSGNNGAITSVDDASAGIRLSLGSQNGCLFGLTDLHSQYVGGCMFSAAAGSFKWSQPAPDSLDMVFDDGTPEHGAFNVSVRPATAAGGGADALDLTLVIARSPSTSTPLTSLLWPSELLFEGNATSAALLPIMPGLWLGEAAFGQPGWPSPTIPLSYPGRGVYADVAWIRMRNETARAGTAPGQAAPSAVSLGEAGVPRGTATLSVLTVTDDLPGRPAAGAAPSAARVIPATLDMLPGKGKSAGLWYLSHGFTINVTSAAPGGPGVVFTSRLVAGATAGGAAREATAAAGLDAAGVTPPLTERLGGAEAAAWMAGAPLTKMDTTSLGKPFSAYKDGVLAPLTAPSLVHLASYEPHGFDRWYPDLLPPNQALGTTLQMRALVDASRGMGHVFMPYTNPTWWDEASPTVTKQMPSQGVTLADIAALNATGQPTLECYGPNCGVAVSATSAFVQSRDADLVAQITTDNTTRHGPGIGSDAIFCDQIGARPPLADRSQRALARAEAAFGQWGAAVGGTAGFARGWQEFVWDNPGALLHTEQGFDKLLVRGGSDAGSPPGVAGFHGQNLLQSFSGGQTKGFCPGGSGNDPGTDPDAGPCWRSVPMASAGIRGRALLYQHDLANLLFDFTPLRLSWDAGMGLQLSRLVSQAPCPNPAAACPWERLVATLHREVVAPLAEARLAAFDVLPGPAGGEAWRTGLEPADGAAASGSPFPRAAATIVTSRAKQGSAGLAAALAPVPGTLPAALNATVASPGAAWSVSVAAPAAPAGGASTPWVPTTIGTVAGSFVSPLFGRDIGAGTHTLVARIGAQGVAAAAGCPAGRPAVALWSLEGGASSLPVPAPAAWSGASGLVAVPVARTVKGRAVTFAKCGSPSPVAAPGPDGLVDVPSAGWTCGSRDSLAVVC